MSCCRRRREQVRAMLDVFLIDLALKKLTFELANAPERIRVPAHASAGIPVRRNRSHGGMWQAGNNISGAVSSRGSGLWTGGTWCPT